VSPWRALVLGLFFLSGISGLLYEVAWTRMLHLLFGDTVLAVSTVLTAFMAGLALGSFWVGRRVDARPRVLGLYAALEVGIAMSAVLLPLALAALTPLYVWLHRQLGEAAGLFDLVRFALAFGLLCVPTSLMGATLPVLSRYMVRRQATLGWNVGALYALNTAGAVIGCFAAGYVLLGRVGLSRTVWIGAAMNLAVALAVWLGRRRMEAVEAPAATASGATPSVASPAGGDNPAGGDDPVRRRVLLAFGLSGVAALSYEVIWTRALAFFIGNSTYAFSAMLTTFLCGLAIGSLLGARLSDRAPRPVALLGALHVAIGVYGALTIAILGHVFYGLDAWWEGFSNAYWGMPVWLTFVKTFAVILPPTLAMGAAFPLVSRIVAGSPGSIGRGVGTAYACNTLGAIAGAWLSGFVAIPLLGLRGSLVTTSLLSIGVGGLLLASAAVRRRRQALVYAGVVAVLVAVVAATPRLRFADIAGEPEKETLHYEEGVAGVVKVATDAYDRKLLSINGWSVAGTGTPNPEVALVNDYPEVQKMLAHLPMLLHPAPRDALVIGFGAGGTTWSLSRHVALARIDVVEFVPGVIRAAGFFPEVNHGVLADPRVRVAIDDGRNYLLVTPRTYDVVSVDTLDPKHAGNGNLYTREFYALSRAVLRPGGIFVQWLPYHQVDNESLKLIARTFQHVFPEATLWLNRFKGYALLVGTLGPLAVDVARLEARFRDPAVQRDLAEVHVATPWQFLEGFTMGPATLRRYTAGSARLNTYDRPSVEFYGVAWHDPVDENLAELARFADDPASLLRFPAGYPAAEQRRARDEIGVHRRISRHIFRGYLANWRRRLQEGTREYRKALRLDPADDGVKFALGVGAVHKAQALAAVERQPRDVRALVKLGYIAWSEQDYDGAVAWVQRALAIDPRHAPAHVHLGVSYAAQQRFDASVAAYREAARLQPELARLAEQSIDLVERLRRVRERPQDADALARLGEVYAGDGRSDRAIESFERVVALAPARAEVHFTLGRLYEAEDRDADALAAYRDGLALEPTNGPGRNGYEKLAIKTALERGAPTTVSLAGGRTLRVDPRDAASHYNLGLRYLQSDEPEDAAFAFRQALALDPGHAEASLFLGLAYTSLGAHERAEAAYRQAIALRPNNPQAYNYLGLEYHEQKRYGDAVAAYRRAIAQAPDYAVAHVNLGASHEALGQREAAVAAYGQALRHDANLEAVKGRIDALRRQLGQGR